MIDRYLAQRFRFRGREVTRIRARCQEVECQGRWRHTRQLVLLPDGDTVLVDQTVAEAIESVRLGSWLF
jgi:hypothetical protein